MLYRGIRNGNSFVDQLLKYVKTGKTFKEPGFASTSVLQSFSKSWAENDGLLLKLKINKGTKGIVVRKGQDGEQEIILQRGAHFQLTHLDKDKRYGEAIVVYDTKAAQKQEAA